MDGKLTRQLKQLIAESGLSEYEIAKRSGVSKGALSRFRTGERNLNLDSVDRLAEVLNLELKQTRKPKREI
jgi:transcriptional regulator with XRE-family HTH domain